MLRHLMQRCAVIVTTAVVSLTATHAVQLPKSGTPYTSIWELTGSFTLYYHGTLDDGTVCPPSINALQWSISHNLGKPEYFHGYSVTGEVAPALKAALQAGTFCSKAFDGSVFFTLNWGKFARITPTQVSPSEPVAVDETPIPRFEGHIHIQVIQPNCLLAPCPPVFKVTAGDEVLAPMGKITLIDGTVEPHVTTNYIYNALPAAEFDGALWVDHGTATILVDKFGN